MNKNWNSRGRKYRSSLLAAVHETAEGLHVAGVINKRTMRKFDVLCLTPVQPLSQILVARVA